MAFIKIMGNSHPPSSLPLTIKMSQEKGDITRGYYLSASILSSHAQISAVLCAAHKRISYEIVKRNQKGRERVKVLYHFSTID